MKIGQAYKMIIDGQERIGTYIGQDDDFSCCICGKGHKAYCFNFYWNEDEYETLGFGKEHLPKLEELAG